MGAKHSFSETIVNAQKWAVAAKAVASALCAD
jgi:hypothetical protein